MGKRGGASVGKRGPECLGRRARADGRARELDVGLQVPAHTDTDRDPNSKISEKDA
jgi:hypothetical protein